MYYFLDLQSELYMDIALGAMVPLLGICLLGGTRQD